MKIKLIKKSKPQHMLPTEPGETLSLHQTEPWVSCGLFIQSCRSFQYSTPKLRKYVAEIYNKTFPKNPYPDHQPIKLVINAVAYELMYRAYKATNKPIPKQIIQNHKASVNFKPEELQGAVRDIIDIQLKQQGDNENMKTKSVLPKKPTPTAPSPEKQAQINHKAKVESKKKMTAGRRYLEIFESAKKLSDAQIAEIINKEFPDKGHKVSDVAKYRGYFNRGKIAGQKSKPKNPITAVTIKQ